MNDFEALDEVSKQLGIEYRKDYYSQVQDMIDLHLAMTEEDCPLTAEHIAVWVQLIEIQLSPRIREVLEDMNRKYTPDLGLQITNQILTTRVRVSDQAVRDAIAQLGERNDSCS